MITIKNLLLSIFTILIIFSVSSEKIYANDEFLSTTDLNVSKNSIIKPETYLIKIPTLSQMAPDFIPMGCECVSETMALQYKGIDLKIKDIISEMNYSDDPRLGFTGDMYSFKLYKGTVPTVWPERVIIHAKKYRPNSFYSNSLTSNQLENEIINNNPVLVWYSWKEVNKPISTADGFIFSSSGLHCTLLVGYDKDHWYFNDPAFGKVRKVNKQEFYKKYLNYGSKSLVIK